MEIDERVDYIEGEITLIKGEIQQALVELRDMVTVMDTRVTESNAQVIEIRGGLSTTDGGSHHPAQDALDEAVPEEEPVAEEEEEERPVSEVDQEETPEDTIEEEEPPLQPPSQLAADQQTAPEDGMPPPLEGLHDLDAIAHGLVPDQTDLAPATSQIAVEVPALDIHSVANLIRWVGTIRPRIGGVQLTTLLEIYESTGHLPETIEELILEAARLDTLPNNSDGQGFHMEEYIDALLQLHAIVSGLEYRPSGYQQQPVQASSSYNGSATMADDSRDVGPYTLPLAPSGPLGNQRDSDGAGQGFSGSGVLDANLVSNLMRWAGSVQPRIGGQQLETLLGVYRLTGNLPPTVERMLFNAAKLEALPSETDSTGFALQDYIDSLLKLHGIVHSTEYQQSGRARESGQAATVIRNRYG